MIEFSTRDRENHLTLTKTRLRDEHSLVIIKIHAYKYVV